MPPATNGFRRDVFCNDCGHRGPQLAVGLCPRCHEAEARRMGHLGPSRLNARKFQDEIYRLGEYVLEAFPGALAAGAKLNMNIVDVTIHLLRVAGPRYSVEDKPLGQTTQKENGEAPKHRRRGHRPGQQT